MKTECKNPNCTCNGKCKVCKCSQAVNENQNTVPEKQNDERIGDES